MFTKITAVVLMLAGIVGLVWGGITVVRGTVTARQTALMLEQMGGGRFQGNEGGAMPGGAFPRANLGGTSTTALGGLMALVSLLLIGVGEALWLLSRLASASVTVAQEREARL